MVYYSATGNVHALADALADGARGVGMEVRQRQVGEIGTRRALAA